MKIVLTGGGTGGHITPLVTIAHKLKSLKPDCEVIFVGEKSSQFVEITKDDPNIDQTYTIPAGKLRRYYGESWLKRLVDVRTNALNMRDAVRVIKGLRQARSLLKKIKPDVVFLKGSFVGVPMGLAAASLKIPMITHDSDAVPGLANKLVARWAVLHTTALPPDNYVYPTPKTRQVGVLVAGEYKPVDEVAQKQDKQKLGLKADAPLLLITGGSLGASRLNRAVAAIIQKLIDDYPDLNIIHQVGKGKLTDYEGFTHPRLQVLEFLKPMSVYTGAADVVICRAGANTLAELGVQGKACIVVPNPDLTGGHQLKNAELLNSHQAAIVVQESSLAPGLEMAVKQLLDNPDQRKSLGGKLRAITPADAADKLAQILIEAAS